MNEIEAYCHNKAKEYIKTYNPKNSMKNENQLRFPLLRVWC